MSTVPIPQRIPPLTWRRPSLLWTPLALALAMLCPAALFYFDGEVSRIALALGAFELGLALLTLGLSWKLAQAPRSRRIVVMHVIAAALLAAVAAPFVLGMAPAILSWASCRHARGRARAHASFVDAGTAGRAYFEPGVRLDRACAWARRAARHAPPNPTLSVITSPVRQRPPGARARPRRSHRSPAMPGRAPPNRSAPCRNSPARTWPLSDLYWFHRWCRGTRD